MNNLAQNNLTFGISKNDLAAATHWLTFGRGRTEWGDRRSVLTHATDDPTAHAMCENTFPRRSNRSCFPSDRPLRAVASHRLHRFALRSGCSAAVLT
jgi:hypothetical protein